VEEEDESAVTTASLLKQADTPETATQIVTDVLSEYLANEMATTADAIDMDLPLSALGGKIFALGSIVSMGYNADNCL
jgi:hypothetical protein